MPVLIVVLGVRVHDRFQLGGCVGLVRQYQVSPVDSLGDGFGAYGGY